MELIIAMAILALLMTAICGLMGVQMTSFKKTKADITVQNSAQETYDNITDAIMQAKNIRLEGYVITSGNKFEFDETNVGAVVSGTDVSEAIYMRGSDIEALPSEQQLGKSDFMTLKTTDGAGTTSYTEVYITKLTIKYAVPMDISAVPADKQSEASALSVDTCTAVYEFDGKNMYLSRTYEYMTTLNDTASGADKSNQLYSSSLNYVELADGTTITGAVATVDAENNSIGIELMFADKSMSYTTLGMVNIRNSYVLKDFE